MKEASDLKPIDLSLKVLIDGDWSAHDFAVFFLAIDKLYAAVNMTVRVATEKRLNLSTIRRHEKNTASITSISYSSPGLINLEGLGEAIDAIRRLLKDVLGGHFQDLKTTSLDIAEKEEKLRHLKQANRLEELRTGLQFADEAASLMRAHGYSDEDVQSFVHRGFDLPCTDLLRLYQQGKLTGITDIQSLPPTKEC
jgi:hypothetical protein